MSLTSLASRLGKIERCRCTGDAEMRAMTDEELIGILREGGSTPEDEALIALFEGHRTPDDFDAQSYLTRSLR